MYKSCLICVKQLKSSTSW